MKVLSIVALVFGAIGLAVAGYHLFETWPNIQSFTDTPRSELGAHSDLVARLGRSYWSAGFQQIYAMWGLGGVSLVLGIIGTVKATGTARKLAIAASLAALATLITSLSTQMASRLG